MICLCSAAIPTESDATEVICYGKHKHRWEYGVGRLESQYDQNAKGFWTTWKKRYSVRITVWGNDYYRAKIKGNCGASKEAGPRWFAADKDYTWRINY